MTTPTPPLSEDSAGYVYVITNRALLNMVKLGMTTRSSRRRCADLGTGSPYDYEVAHEVAVSHVRHVEALVHSHFAKMRINPNREWFSVEVDEAIDALELITQPYRLEYIWIEEDSCPILDELKNRFKEDLRGDLVDARVVHLRNERCFLEIKLVGPRGESIEQINLDFIIETYRGREREAFSGNRDRKARENAEALVQMDPYSIINCTPLLTEAACFRIGREFGPKLAQSDEGESTILVAGDLSQFDR